MYHHRVLFRIKNPFHRYGDYFSNLLAIHHSNNTHIGLGGKEPHWLLEVKLGRGAGYKLGRSLYIGRNLFARPTYDAVDCQLKTTKHLHWQYGGSKMINHSRQHSQGLRIPWQVGWTHIFNALPYVDG